MNGRRYLLDTTAIITLLQGNKQISQLLNKADWLGISIISQIEFLSFPELSSADQQLFNLFIQRVEVVDLESTNDALMSKIIEIRQQFRLKLPDAVIAATAIHNSASVVTADKTFSKVDGLSVVDWA